MYRSDLPFNGYLIVLILSLAGCGAAKPEATTYRQYEDGEIGWSARFPDTWEIVPDVEANSTEERGVKKLEKTTNRDIQMDHTRLLWIRNGKKNSFTSNKMAFDFRTADAYNANMLRIQEVLVKTHEQNGITADYKHDTMVIDGLEFKTFEIAIYSGGRIAAHQLMCTRYIDSKFGLVLNINYTNERNKQVLMDVLKSSKFAIRN